jgi:hypothetical protein
MATIGKLVVSLSANSAKLVSELGKTRKSVKKWGADIAKVVAKAGAVFAGLALIIGGAVLVAINRNAAAIDDMTKAAGKLNFPIEDFQKFGYIAGLSNISMDKFGVSMQKMQKSIGDARAGLSTAKDAFAALNLNFNELANMSPSQQFELIAEAMSKVPLQADKVKLAMDIFGRSGADLLNVFAGDVKAVGAEFDGLGVAITESQAMAVAAYQDSKTKLGELLGGFGKNLSAEVAPAFTLIIGKITESIKKMGGMKSAANIFANHIIDAMNSAINAISSVASAILQVKGFLLDVKLLTVVLGEKIASIDFTAPKEGGSIFSRESGGIDPAISSLPEIEAKIQRNIEAQARLAEGLGALNRVVIEAKDVIGKEFNDSHVQAYLKRQQELNDGTKSLTETSDGLAKKLEEVTKSKAWQDIFGKEDVTARANQFDQYAKLAKANIDSGSKFTGENIKVLKSILETSTNNGGSGFSTNNLFEKLDLKGMAEVIAGLEGYKQQQDVSAASGTATASIDKLITQGQVSQNVMDKIISAQKDQKTLGKLELTVTNGDSQLKGNVFGDPEFMARFKAEMKKTNNDEARAVAQ